MPLRMKKLNAHVAYTLPLFKEIKVIFSLVWSFVNAQPKQCHAGTTPLVSKSKGLGPLLPLPIFY